MDWCRWPEFYDITLQKGKSGFRDVGLFDVFIWFGTMLWYILGRIHHSLDIPHKPTVVWMGQEPFDLLLLEERALYTRGRGALADPADRSIAKEGIFRLRARSNLYEERSQQFDPTRIAMVGNEVRSVSSFHRPWRCALQNELHFQKNIRKKKKRYS